MLRRSILRIPVRPMRAATARPVMPQTCILRRAYSDNGQPNLENLGEQDLMKLMGNPLIKKLISSPRAMEALKETTKVLSEKNYTGNMGVMKQVQLMMDKGVRNKMLELKKIMDEEGIELRQEDMQGLLEVMGLENKK